MCLHLPPHPRPHAPRHHTGSHRDIAATRTGGSDVSLHAPRGSRLHTLCAPTRHRTGSHHDITATRTGGSDVSLRAPLSRLHAPCAPTRHRTGGGHHDIAVARKGGE